MPTFIGFKAFKDYTKTVKFLKMEDEFDKLLTGLSLMEEEGDENIAMQLFPSENEDLTIKFKKDFLVGKIIG